LKDGFSPWESNWKQICSTDSKLTLLLRAMKRPPSFRHRVKNCLG
jgi:hypothetical protein